MRFDPNFPLMAFLTQLTAWLEPWKVLYSDSTPISTAVTGTHILALLLSGGLAIAADRSTLRTLRLPVAERARHLLELHAVHRPVLISLSVLVATGMLLAAADLQTFVASPLFWVKLVLVMLLMANGIVLYRSGRHLLAEPPVLSSGSYLARVAPVHLDELDALDSDHRGRHGPD